MVIPSCVYTPAGMGEFIACRRWHLEPEPGDIVFYNFSTSSSDDFSMPHVGVVIDTDAWKTEKSFVAVEGGVAGSVVAVKRDSSLVIGFGRPDYKRRHGSDPKMQTGMVYVNAPSVLLGSTGRDVLNVQLALEQVVGLDGHAPGVFDQRTRRAFARWQRMIGYVGDLVNGVPDPRSLAELGRRSGVFTTRRDES